MSNYYKSLQGSAQVILEAYRNGDSDEQLLQVYKNETVKLMHKFSVTLAEVDADLTQAVQQNQQRPDSV